MKNFFLIVGKNGTFAPEDDRAITDEINGIYSKPQDVDRLFDFLDKNTIKKIAVHFHGGLVSQANGLEAARNMASVFTQADAFPIAFIWKTGILEVSKQIIYDTQTSELFNELKRIVIKRAKDRIEDGTGSKGFRSAVVDIDSELSKDEPFSSFKPVMGGKGGSVSDPDSQVFEDELSLELQQDIEVLIPLLQRADPAEVKNLKADGIYDHQRPGAKGIISAKMVFALLRVVRNVVRRFRNDTDHGLYCTAVEEIYRELYIDRVGSAIWKKIKNKAKNMWKTDPTATGLDQFVGTYFLGRLYQHATKQKGFTFNFVGHSAGAIVACHMLEAINKSQKGLKIDKAIFLAPACQTKLFEKVVKLKNFGRFYLFAMKDDFERKDRLVPVLYPYSLLYFVSGLLEGTPDLPILGMERHFRSLTSDNRVFITTNSIMSLTADGSEDGKRSLSEKHGDFDNDPETLGSILKILK